MHAFSKPLNRFSRNLRWGRWKEETYVHKIYRAKHAEPKIKLTWYFDTVSSFAGEWLVAVSKVVSLSLSQKGPFKDILWLEDVNIQGALHPCQNMPSFDISILVSSPTQEIMKGIIYIYFTFGGFVCWKKIPEVHRSNRKLQDSETKLHITSIIHKERRFFKKDVELRYSVPGVLSSL